MQHLKIIQLIIAILLTITILLQNRGSGLSEVFGGSSHVYLTKRGLEKKLFIATIVFSILFFIISLANIAL
ncbi:MAG: preprotein translocase subunit SecG [Patescibacteria group bacterium]|nr:preprotein translocase subunit SecG [Patescibacteria group bacterium]MBU2474499.1 preprotein translocase subunit SecG [Patescibacteria group bacterium]